MTCIVALEIPDSGVCVGSDAWLGDGSTVDRVSTPKMCKVGPWLIGYAGIAGHAQAVLDHLDVPARNKRAHDAWIRSVFRRAAKAALESLPSDDSDGLQAVFLVMVDGLIWHVDGSCAVTRSAHGYAAIGTGAAVALGALHATAGKEPRKRILAALHAAAAHSDGVAPPFHVEVLA